MNFSGEGTFTTAQNVVFTFNFCEKTISTVDLAGNKFDVNANGESSAVAGKHNAATDTVICDTLPLREFIRAKKPANCSSHARGPRLFALKPDGSGMEILRESDLLPELVKLSEDPQTAMHESPVTFDDADASVTSTCVSVLTKRGRAKSIYSEQKTAVNSSETFVIERRVCQASGRVTYDNYD